MGKVAYLTGAPASGKSSLTKRLQEQRPDLLVWEYGARLTDYVSGRRRERVDQSEIRHNSGQIVTPEDIKHIDQELTDYVASNRAQNDIIIDSHPVTKETYGFRITSFSFEQLHKLAPDEIWVLYVDAATTIERIKSNPAGRPEISREEATLHTNLQASVAASYAIGLGCTVYLFDNTQDQGQLVNRLLERLG